MTTILAFKWCISKPCISFNEICHLFQDAIQLSDATEYDIKKSQITAELQPKPPVLSNCVTKAAKVSISRENLFK